MKTILVTGSNGQLGSEIRNLSSSCDFFDFIFTDFEELDISNFKSLEKFFAKNKIDFLINCAAYTNVDKAESEKEKAFLINGKAMENLVKMCEKHNCKLIHISTDYVFNGKKYFPYKEDDKENPNSVYGKSKLAGEKIIINSNIEYIILRTSWLYSSYGNNFVKTILKLAKKVEKLSVIFDQIGTPTYAKDLSKIIFHILKEKIENKKKFKKGIYNFSNEGVCSWFDFSKEIIDFYDINLKLIPIETKDFPTVAKRPHYSVLNKSKLKREFNYEIPHWKDSLLDCLKQMK